MYQKMYEIEKKNEMYEIVKKKYEMYEIVKKNVRSVWNCKKYVKEMRTILTENFYRSQYRGAIGVGQKFTDYWIRLTRHMQRRRVSESVEEIKSDRFLIKNPVNIEFNFDVTVDLVSY